MSKFTDGTKLDMKGIREEVAKPLKNDLIRLKKLSLKLTDGT